MSSYVSSELRRLVAERAAHVCEYCLIAEENEFHGFEVDHIISEKHGGPTQEENLAHACTACNRAKGSDVGSYHWENGTFVRFFNPRSDRWADHFVLLEDRIDARTDVGAVTARILGFNTGERLLERRELRAINKYPVARAVSRMTQQ